MCPAFLAVEGTLKRESSSRDTSKRQHAADLDAYLASLPADKREALQTLAGLNGKR